MAAATTLPTEMTCIEISRPGGPEVLMPTTRPVPRPGSGEVLIKVAAAGVNRPDINQRQGSYPAPPGASDLPGLEIAGTIVALGPDATGWQIGDRACALVSGGGYAAYCTAPTVQCLPVPMGYSMVQAAALPETFFTVWTNVFERGRLVAGEKFLIHGGTSGIGTTAIQLARAFGARVFATAGSDDKARVCEKLGAERGINYRTEDFVEIVKPLGGVDLILDMVGGPYFQRNLSALATEGRLVNIAFLQGSKIDVNLVPIMLKRLTVTGSTLRPRTVAQKGAIAAALKAQVWPLLEQGKVAPQIHATFSLADAASAHRLMESSAHVGKLILQI